jgi:hypothetical protein
MRILCVAVLCAALCGCASVSRGTSETISVATTPSGAEATISGLDQPTVCTTPCAFIASRSADIVVSIAKEGYEPQVVPLSKEVTGSGGATFAGNLLLGGVIGMGVDAATGAAMDHKPNPVIVTLKSFEPPPPPPRPSVKKPKRKPVPTS